MSTQEISFLLTLSFHLPTEIELRKEKCNLKCSKCSKLQTAKADNKAELNLSYHLELKYLVVSGISPTATTLTLQALQALKALCEDLYK